jgi:hypothetical protein
MRLSRAIFGVVLLTGISQSSQCCAQTNAQIYTLLSGSTLTDDCPFCDRLPIVLPVTGTFTIQLLEENPLFTRYELKNISWTAGSNSGPQYVVSGSGVYQVGGEVAIGQDLFLDVEVDQNHFSTTEAFCVNSDRTVAVAWPKLQIHLDQTNGTPSQIYRFELLAVPAPIISSCVLEPQTGSVRLTWEASGDKYQVERAKEAAGPYSAVSPVTTNSSFTDAGVLTNSARFFYRLLKY